MAAYKYIIGLIFVSVLFLIISIYQQPTFPVEHENVDMHIPYYFIGVAYLFYLIIVATVYFMVRNRPLILILKKLHFIAIALLTVLVGLVISIPDQMYASLGIEAGQEIGNDVAILFVAILFLIIAQLLLPINVVMSIFKQKLSK